VFCTLLVVKGCCLLQRITEIIPGLALIALLDLYTHEVRVELLLGRRNKYQINGHLLTQQDLQNMFHSLLDSM
jgi:hypothetical protein